MDWQQKALDDARDARLAHLPYIPVRTVSPLAWEKDGAGLMRAVLLRDMDAIRTLRLGFCHVLDERSAFRPAKLAYCRSNRLSPAGDNEPLPVSLIVAFTDLVLRDQSPGSEYLDFTHECLDLRNDSADPTDPRDRGDHVPIIGRGPMALNVVGIRYHAISVVISEMDVSLLPNRVEMCGAHLRPLSRRECAEAWPLPMFQFDGDYESATWRPKGLIVSLEPSWAGDFPRAALWYSALVLSTDGYFIFSDECEDEVQAKMQRWLLIGQQLPQELQSLISTIAEGDINPGSLSPIVSRHFELATRWFLPLFQ